MTTPLHANHRQARTMVSPHFPRPAAALPGQPPMERLGLLESLRGLLALWVLVGHAVKLSGYDPQALGPLKLLADPGLAVDDFIILSGFVIFLLLDRQRPAYGSFLLTRFFRLWPVYGLVLLVSALLQPAELFSLVDIPWSGQAIVNEVNIHIHALSHPAAYFLTHLTMLHGLVPAAWLPFSDYALIGQGWSISVEWQFYLLAPLFFLAWRTQSWRMAGFALLAVCLLRHVNYGGEGFAANQAAWFLIGVGSYFLYRRADDVAMGPAFDLAAGFAAALAYLLLPGATPVLVWIFVLWAAVRQRQGRGAGVAGWALRFLDHPAMRRLGQVSYSVYMLHMLVIYGLSSALLALFPKIGQAAYCLSLVLLALPATVLLAAVTWRLVEVPGISLGRRLAARPGRAGLAEAGQPALLAAPTE